MLKFFSIYIAGRSFFVAGIERIVDQVSNPNLNTNSVPKIEEVAYNFMSVEQLSEWNWS